MQNHPPFSSYLENTPQPGQLHPLSLIWAFGTVDAPRAQNSIMGGDSLSLFGMKVGHGPQNFAQIAPFSGVSGTSIGIEIKLIQGGGLFIDY